MSTSRHPEDLQTVRKGERLYTGSNGRGAVVEMGPVDVAGAFTPGELLKIALAGCVGMSADFRFRRVLGDEFEVTVRVETSKADGEDRYETFRESIEVDLSGLDEDTRAKTVDSVQKAVDRLCTVGNTIKASAAIDPIAYL
ncbi:MAG: OsmC family protein [Promicromonosporaceae bacterium]|nr:OsmC family protein [Promicromonosporaceae bacterium]